MSASVAAMDSERYSQVLRDLTAFVTEPVWSAEPTTDDLLRRRVRRDWKRLRRYAQAAVDVEGELERHAALHEVRKAAKRLRYSAETLVPTHGDDAAQLRGGPSGCNRISVRCRTAPWSSGGCVSSPSDRTGRHQRCPARRAP